MDLRLSFALDGLGALYALLATGVGALVFAYGTRYLTVHLEHEDRPAGERWRFWPWMALFAVAMVGLATAQDLVLLFVFFDLTAVCSYFLIGFDRGRREARTAALMALLVTVVSAVAMLVAAVLLYAEYGTFSIPELIARTGPGPVTTIAAALLAVAGVAKSAQVPAALLAAPRDGGAHPRLGLPALGGDGGRRGARLGRVHPLLERSAAVLTGLLVVGGLSILVGGVLALRQDVLKQVLAYSTISQYGYVVLMYGIGSAAGNGAAAFYVLAHGVAKSALFMAAGAVTLATGEDRLSRLGGLGRRMPLLAVATGLAAASLAALPLTVGFFKDELFFTAALGAGPLDRRAGGGRGGADVRLHRAVLDPAVPGAPQAEAGDGVVGARRARGRAGRRLACSAAWSRRRSRAWPRPRAPCRTGRALTVTPAYHLDARPENLMALAAWAFGGLLLVARRPVGWVSRGLAAAGERLGSTADLRGGAARVGARVGRGARPGGARPAHQHCGRARSGRCADRPGLRGHPDGRCLHAGAGGRSRLAGVDAARVGGRGGVGDRAGRGTG